MKLKNLVFVFSVVIAPHVVLASEARVSHSAAIVPNDHFTIGHCALQLLKSLGFPSCEWLCPATCDKVTCGSCSSASYCAELEDLDSTLNPFHKPVHVYVEYIRNDYIGTYFVLRGDHGKDTFFSIGNAVSDKGVVHVIPYPAERESFKMVDVRYVVFPFEEFKKEFNSVSSEMYQEVWHN
ncbi:MAG: hypothetical protein QG632_325 [Candidatus Dependentiae bacterium]|nr:hypothetical protein [Candidatus Dependentiae bacterium]